MEIVTTPDNPAPPGVTPAIIRAVDGLSLRVLRWHAPSPRGTIVIAPGRAEFVEKYFETVGDLLDRGFAVVAFDWRGQGLSARELRNRSKGHIDDFSLYERDLDALVQQALEPFCPRPWFALGHSMGASVLIAQARAGRSPFERLVLSAPMIGIRGLRFPLGAKLLAEGLDIAGFGGAFVPGGRARPYLSQPFERNVLTSDRARYERCAGVLAACPDIGLGDPTIGWINAAFRLMDQFADPNYPRGASTPTLIVAAGRDRVVDTRATERFASRLKAGRALVLPHCLHEILLERDEFRQQFWAAFDCFVPGTAERSIIAANPQTASETVRRRSAWRLAAGLLSRSRGARPPHTSADPRPR